MIAGKHVHQEIWIGLQALDASASEELVAKRGSGPSVSTIGFEKLHPDVRIAAHSTLLRRFRDRDCAAGAEQNLSILPHQGKILSYVLIVGEVRVVFAENDVTA